MVLEALVGRKRVREADITTAFHPGGNAVLVCPQGQGDPEKARQGMASG